MINQSRKGPSFDAPTINLRYRINFNKVEYYLATKYNDPRGGVDSLTATKNIFGQQAGQNLLEYLERLKGLNFRLVSLVEDASEEEVLPNKKIDA